MGVVLETGFGEAGDEAVVVLDWNRIIFVVVTASAADRQAEHGRSKGVNDVVQLFVATAFSLFLCLLGRKWAGGEESGGGLGHRVGRFHLIARDLQFHEAVVGHVLIQRPDHKVAVVIGVASILIEGVAVALGEASKIEPVACPSFSVVRVGQESVDEILIGLGRIVAEIGFDLARFRGESP